MDAYQQLSQQTLGQPLSEQETAFAAAIEQAFAASTHDPDKVADHLNSVGAARPSGAAGPWTAAVLAAELRTINKSLDDTYASGRNVPQAGTR